MLYCVASHGAILRVIRGADREAKVFVEEITANYKKAGGVTLRQLKMLDFAVKLSRNSEHVCQEDVEELRSFGFSQQAVWDVVMISSFFAMSNRIASAMDLKPNEEFYLMGRKEETQDLNNK